MIILDENVLDSQRLLLAASRMAPKQIGVDVGRKGLKDEQIILLLRKQVRPTFFTRDAGFYRRDLRHDSYCLVVTAVEQTEVAAFIRRFLRHSNFDSWAKRAGHVLRLTHKGISVWRSGVQQETRFVWKRPG